MKHRLPFGSLELPDDWEDRTAYQFVSRPTPLELPMAAGKGVQVTGTRTSVVVTRTEVAPGTSLERFLEERLEEMQRGFAGFVLHGRAPTAHPRAGAVPCLDFSFNMGAGTPIRQLQLYFPTAAGNVFSTLTLSCEAAQYERRKAALDDIIRSFDAS